MASRLHSRLANRIQASDVSFRTRMLEIAATLEDVIAMGRQGTPTSIPRGTSLKPRSGRSDEHRYHYTHPTGLPELRTAIAEALEADFGLRYSTEEVVVTAGVQESIMLSMLGIVEEGDEVLITSPRFTSYDSAVELCGGIPSSSHARG